MSYSERFSEFYPPKPDFPAKDIPDQSGKVFIVTGGASGVGYETTKVLYQKSATVYIAGRSRENGQKAIDALQAECPSATGKLVFLFLDLSDLRGIGASAQEFLKKEKRLDVLWLNAGVMHPPVGSVTAQGFDLQLGTNCIGHFLFTKFLTPILTETAKVSLLGTVRVIFVSSSAHHFAPSNGGIKWDDINYKNGGGVWEVYGQSKAGSILLGLEFSKRFANMGVLGVSLNPGNLKSGLQRYGNCATTGFIADNLLLHHASYGGLTELFSGLSPEITPAKNGCYIIPWGRFGTIRADIQNSDTGRFWEWCEE